MLVPGLCRCGFSIQLDNACELMCYQLRDGEGRVSPYSSGTFVDEAGNSTRLTAKDFVVSEDGKAQKIETFSFQEVAATSPGALSAS